MKIKHVAILMAATLAFAWAGCQSATPLASTPPDLWHVPKIKVALYLDIGCRGGGAIQWARLLKSAPEIACTFIDAADLQAGKLKDFEVLVMPGGGGLERYDRLGDTRATVEDALALDARDDVDVRFVRGEEIAEGALDHADVLLLPGGAQKRMWRSARPLIEEFKAVGHRVVTSGKDL